MTFRARLLIAFLAVAVVPLFIIGVVVRRQMGDAVVAQYQQRVAALVAVIREDLTRRDRMVADRLSAVGEALRADNRFRRDLLQEAGTSAYVLDYALQAMTQSGLAMLQIQDERGRIVSSGNFRAEYGLAEPALPTLLAATPAGMGLAHARTPEARFLALVRVDSLRVGSRGLTLVGGVAVEGTLPEALGSPGELVVSVSLPGDSSAAWTAAEETVVAGEFGLPYVDSDIGTAGETGTARIVVAQSLAPLNTLRRSVDLGFALALGGSAVLAALMATGLASRISRPLADLARKASKVRLDGLEVEFASKRPDEIGSLARLLGAMTARLRDSVRTLKEVERRAAVGDLARQVNHDIKNGLTPIRNVFRHLAEVARDEPDRLPDVFGERRQTIESSVEYLEKLAATYAGLYPKLELTRCDLAELVERVVRGTTTAASVDLREELADRPLTVRGDELALRRVIDNLITNAIDSLPESGGRVTVTAARNAAATSGPSVRLTVADTGRGMTGEELDRAFGAFYTTKSAGTGLGLPIVRRLVLDLGGALRVESEPRSGSRFIVELPAERGGG